MFLGMPEPRPVSVAEELLAITEQGANDRQVRLKAEEQARQDAERAVRLAELSLVQTELQTALAQRVTCYATIRRQLITLAGEVERLDALGGGGQTGG